jgi:hypothetical protein
MQSIAKYLHLLSDINFKTLVHKACDEKDFIDTYGDLGKKMFNIVKNTKSGLISVYKVSDNPGIEKGKIYSGLTTGFGEGIALFIDAKDYWFHTSVIKSIDWDKSEFKTMNSTYHFDFEELDDSSINLSD